LIEAFFYINADIDGWGLGDVNIIVENESFACKVDSALAWASATLCIMQTLGLLQGKEAKG